MADINTITLTGRAGDVPEFKAFDSGAVMATFSLAVNRWDNKTKAEVTDWLIVKTFSKLAEHIEKGNKLAVTGQLQTANWENDKGEKKKLYTVFANQLTLLNPKKSNENSDEPIVQMEEMTQDELIGEEEIPF